MVQNYESPLFPIIDDLIAMRPEPADAVAQAIAKTEMQDKILRRVIQAGEAGLLMGDLADSLGESFTHVQRVTNVMRHERINRYPILRPHTGRRVELDTMEFNSALRDIEEIAQRSDDSLRALGDTALHTMLNLSLIDTRSETTAGRNLETVTLLLAHAGLPVGKWQLVKRYRAMGLLMPHQDDGNFYRRLDYMRRQPLFAQIIRTISNSNHPSYTISPYDLDMAREAGLITFSLNEPAIPKPQKQPKPAREKPIAKTKPTPIPASELIPAPKPDPGSTVSLEQPQITVQPIPLVDAPVYILGLSEKDRYTAFTTIQELRASRRPVKLSKTKRVLLAKVAEQYELQTGFALLAGSLEDDYVRIGINARRSQGLIFFM